MLLSTKIKLGGGAVIDYSYNPQVDMHIVSYHEGALHNLRVKACKLPGEAINALVAYRGNRDVDVLITWLQGQSKLAGE